MSIKAAIYTFIGFLLNFALFILVINHSKGWSLFFFLMSGVFFYVMMNILFSTDDYEEAERKKREENAKRPIIIKGEITITTSTNPKINPNKKGKILTKRF